MKNKNDNFTLIVNGEKIDTVDISQLAIMSDNYEKTIINQENPLLDRARLLVNKMEKYIQNKHL